MFSLSNLKHRFMENNFKERLDPYKHKAKKNCSITEAVWLLHLYPSFSAIRWSRAKVIKTS